MKRVVLLLLIPSIAFGTIIPDNRLAPWQGNVGVPGGIPTRTTIWKNIVTDLGADPTGNVDAAPIITTALTSCPAGQVVYMPAGTFKVATPIYPAAKNNFTLRGAGQGQTILHVTTNNVPIYSSGLPPNQTPIPSQITDGATLGSNVITVPDTSSFVPDNLFSVRPVTPIWAHNLGGYSDTIRNIAGLFKVRSKTSTTITFDPPCPFDFSGMSPLAQASGGTMIQGVGYESFTVELVDSTAGWAIQLSNAWGCWIYDVEIAHAYNRQTVSTQAVRCEYRHCNIHDVRAVGSNHEGMDFTNSGWNLVEDNLFNKGGAPPLIFGDGGGKSLGNVIAYNFFVNTSSGYADISVNHGPHDMLNLIEGNIALKYEDDGYFGSSSHNTLFRNSLSDQIQLKHFSTYYNIVGNVLGALSLPNFTRTYETEISDYWSSNLYPVYELGFPNVGNAHHDGTFIGPTTPPDYSAFPNTLDACQQLDRNVKSTIIRHGNYDYANHAVVWDANILDHSIPNSLYLSGRPSWWDSSQWPPIGSDLSPMVGTIPAQCRYMNCTTSSPTPSPTATPTPNEPLQVRITFTDDDTSRVRATAKDYLHLDHTPSDAEVKTFLIDILRVNVFDYERKQFVLPPFDPQ